MLSSFGTHFQTAASWSSGAAPLALMLVVFGWGGCQEEEAPAPPEIQHLNLGETSLILDGGYESLNGLFEFRDPNGDAESVRFEVVLPDGTVQQEGPLAAAGLPGRVSGTVSFSLVYSRQTLGLYQVTVWLLDSEGQASNELTGEIRSRY